LLANAGEVRVYVGNGHCEVLAVAKDGLKKSSFEKSGPVTMRITDLSFRKNWAFSDGMDASPRQRADRSTSTSIEDLRCPGI